jgi:outer membrane protein
MRGTHRISDVLCRAESLPVKANIINTQSLMRQILISLVVALFCVVGYHFLSGKGESRIGYVRSGVILQNYLGMEEAHKTFEKEMVVVRGNLDTLRFRYEALKRQEASQKQDAEFGYRLAVAEKEYMDYGKRASEEMEAREAELSKNATDKINAFVEEFGRKNEYRLILGANGTGNVMYGTEGDDITDIILTELNARYKINNPAPTGER